MNPKPRTYDELHARVKQLQAEGRLPTTLSRDEKIDWAYGNTVIENADITREIVEFAYDTKVREPG